MSVVVYGAGTLSKAGHKIRSNQDLFQETRGTVSLILTLWLQAIWSLIVDSLFYGPYTFCTICEHFLRVPGIFWQSLSENDNFGWEKKSLLKIFVGDFIQLRAPNSD